MRCNVGLEVAYPTPSSVRKWELLAWSALAGSSLMKYNKPAFRASHYAHSTYQSIRLPTQTRHAFTLVHLVL